MINVAKLSFAHTHAKGYAERIRSNAETRLVAVWDEPEYGGRARADEYGVPYYEDLHEVLARPDVDAVVVDAVTSKHPEVIIAAAEAGKHIYTEKALAITVEECDRIIEAVRKADVTFMISLPSRANPDILTAKRAVDEGLLGRLTFGRGRGAHSGALDGWFGGPSAWFVDPERAGGGALFDLGCHRVDVMRWLMGTPKSAIAKINNVAGTYAVDDNSAAIVEFEGNALAVVDVSWTHRCGPNMLELYGTEGSLVIGDGKTQLESRLLGAEEQTKWLEAQPAPPPDPMQQWINAIVRGESMTIGLEDARNLTELLEAFYVSSREGREVKLPL